MLKKLINRLRGKRDETPEGQQEGEPFSPVDTDVPKENANQKKQDKKEQLTVVEPSVRC
jgi:hypothetical protein